MATSDITTQSLNEEWRDIPGYEGKYQVCNIGKIKSFARKEYLSNGYILTHVLDSKGYHCVRLYNKNHSWKQFKVHVIVAEVFIGTRPIGKQINHIDGDKANNCATNLEYCSASENSLHALRLGLAHPPFGVVNGNSKLDDDKIREIRKLIKQGYYSYEAIGHMYGVHESTIERISRRVTWKHVID